MVERQSVVMSEEEWGVSGKFWGMCCQSYLGAIHLTHVSERRWSLGSELPDEPGDRPPYPPWCVRVGMLSEETMNREVMESGGRVARWTWQPTTLPSLMMREM